MSLFGDISLLGTAMQNFQTAVSVTSNNIANATTPGYSPEVANFTEASPLISGNLILGTGSAVSSVGRLRNIYLDNQIRLEMSQQGKYSVLSTVSQELAALFPDVASPGAAGGLTSAISNLSSAWTALSASPTSTSAEKQVVSSASALATLFNQTAQGLYSLYQNLDSQVGGTITQINSDLDQIAAYNRQILQAQAAAGGAQPNTLLDAREQVMENLSRLMNVNFNTAANGTVSVSGSFGTLVQGTQAFHLIGIPSPNNPGTTDVGYGNTANGYGSPLDVTSSITAGQLGGLLQARDTDVRQAMLTLNEMAYGIIQRANAINETFVAADGTTGHDIFTGSKASDMSLNTALNSNPGYVGGTRNASQPGDLAIIQAAQQDFVLSSEISSPLYGGTGVINKNPATPLDPTASLAGQATNFKFATPTASGQLVIASGGNAVTVNWNSTQSINSILANINVASGGAFYAVFNSQQQRVEIFGKTPLSVYDASGNLGQAFGLTSIVTSSAPINNSPIAGLNQVVASQALDSQAMTLDYFTKATATGKTQVDSSTFNWTDTQTLNGVLGSLGASTITSPSGHILVGFNQQTQVITLLKYGFSPYNNLLTQANPLVSIGLGDVSGNFAEVGNFQMDQSLNGLYGGLLTSVESNSSTYGAFSTQAGSTVSSLQGLQESVNTSTETANATQYQLAYDAAVRVQSVAEQMLNFLIDQVGVATTTVQNGTTPVS